MFTAKLTHRHAVLGLTQDRPFRSIALQSPAGQRMICAAVYLPVFIQNLLMRFNMMYVCSLDARMIDGPSWIHGASHISAVNNYNVRGE